MTGESPLRAAGRRAPAPAHQARCSCELLLSLCAGAAVQDSLAGFAVDLAGLRRGIAELHAETDSEPADWRVRIAQRSAGRKGAGDLDLLLAIVRSADCHAYQLLERAGVAGDRILVDPGLGFGKTSEQSAALLAASDYLTQQTGCPVLIGASRKGFIGALTGRPVGERLIGSVAAAVLAVLHGASVVRVHDVAATVEALRVVAGVRSALHGPPGPWLSLASAAAQRPGGPRDAA